MMRAFLFMSCVFFSHILQMCCGAAEYRPLSVEKSMKVKTHDKPTTRNVNGPNHHCPIPIAHTYNHYYYNGSHEYYLVNIRKRHNTISAHSLLQVVERNGKFMLILGDTDPYSENTLFKRIVRHHYLSRDRNYEIVVYYFESCKFPGHYICWHDDSAIVDIEPYDDPQNSMFFLWRVKVVSDGSVKIEAVNSLPISYLTFEESDNHPVVQPYIDDATKFDIKFSPQ